MALTALIVAVSVALAVGAPVMVAALANRNDFVKVFDTARCTGAITSTTTAPAPATGRPGRHSLHGS